MSERKAGAVDCTISLISRFTAPLTAV